MTALLGFGFVFLQYTVLQIYEIIEAAKSGITEFLIINSRSILV
jgi:hypothetical protein